MRLLHIDSSISGEQSVSRKLTASVVAHLKRTIPDLEVTYRDIVAVPIPHLSPALQSRKIQALSGSEPEQIVTVGGELVSTSGHHKKDDHLEQEFALVNQALDEFLVSDIIVLGAPMYNFAIPSQLKAWIDCFATPGQTFRYTEHGVEGLCGDKKLIIASSRGGIYAPSSPMADFDHQERYLTSFFNFIGISDITFVRVEGVNMGGEQRDHALSEALTTITTLQVA